MNKVSIWLSAILSTAVLAAPATANVLAQTQISGTIGGFSYYGAADDETVTSGIAQADSVVPNDEGNVFGFSESEAHATASFGTLKGFSLVNNGGELLFTAQTTSSFEDLLSIVLLNDSDIELLPGTPGFADIRVAYNWSVLGPSSNGGANAFIFLDLPGGGAMAAESPGFLITPLTVSGSTQAIDSALRDFFTVRVPFTSGDDLAISLRLITDVLIDGPGFGRADASHSAYWGGIVAVRDSDLNIVPYNVTSASGTDYRRTFVPGEVPTVPEPATLSMLCCGFVFLLNRRVRRGRRLPMT